MALPNEIPKLTLGWGVLNWCSTWLRQPDGNRNHEAGSAWRFTREQALFILHFYAINENGDWLYDRAVLERPKGWGKSPLLAALCCAEMLGPVAFSHFNPDGTPVGKQMPSALIQIAAISEDQTDNTLALVGEMLGGRAQAHYRLTILLSQITAPGLRKIMRVTASPRSREGNRPTFVVMDETHLWLPVEKGPELADVLTRNLTKRDGRSVETTNAPVPGQGSVAEMSHDYNDQIESGVVDDPRLLFDSRTVTIKDIYDKEAAFEALIYVYGDAADPETGWINLERVWRYINDPARREWDLRRFYFNQLVQEETQWIKEDQWEKAKVDTRPLKKQDLITLGFAAVRRNGAAALVAYRAKDGVLFNLGLWEKPGNLAKNVEWELPVARVDARVRKWLAKDNVRYMCANPWTMQDVVGQWFADFEDIGEGIWLNQHLKQAKMVDQFENAILSDPPTIHHPGDPGLTRHLLNAHIEEKITGYVLRKDREHSTKYIAGAQAAILAYQAYMIATDKGLLKPPPDRQIYGF